LEARIGICCDAAMARHEREVQIVFCKVHGMTEEKYSLGRQQSLELGRGVFSSSSGRRAHPLKNSKRTIGTIGKFRRRLADYEQAAAGNLGD